MGPRIFRIAIGCLLAMCSAITIVGIDLYTGEGNGAQAATYSPSMGVQLCNALPSNFPVTNPSTDADLAGNPNCVDTPIPASSVRDITSTVTVPAGTSMPGSAVISNSMGTVASDAAIPDGEKVGAVTSQVTLSLLNGPCATSLTAEFILYDAATSDQFTVDPLPEGTANRFSNLATDANSDQLADANSPAITSNLGIYKELLTPANGSYIAPLARYTGLSQVPLGGDWQIVSVFEYPAGSLDAFATDPDDAPHQFGRASHSPTTGNLEITILGDPTATQATASPITDFCSPLVAQTMLLGETPGGQTRYRTPTAGTTGFSAFTYGQRDADDDGIGNQSDGCPLTADSGTDSDNDGLDNSCDPTPNTNTGIGDHDGDGFYNRQDNCPLIANGGTSQTDSESDEAWIDSAPNGGPKTDGIGDACDPHPLTASTEGDFEQSYLLTVKCIGATDADGDGYCAAQDLDDGDDNTGGFTMNKGMDPEYPGVLGGHGDFGGGNWENYWGTDPLICDDPLLPPPPGPSTWWPPDLVASGSITISDVLALKPVFNLTVPPVDPRYDLVPSKSITISDVLAMKPVFNKTCG